MGKSIRLEVLPLANVHSHLKLHPHFDQGTTQCYLHVSLLLTEQTFLLSPALSI